MTDLLGEALARETRFDRTADEDDVILAAARSWHTLTNPTDELIDRVATAIGPCIHEGCHSDRKQEASRAVKAVVDALTVTAEPESEYEASFDPNYQQER